MIRAIVGADGHKWRKDQIPIVKDVIIGILKGHEVPPYLKGDSRVAELWINNRQSELIIVSGHCPVGEELPYCVDCDIWKRASSGYFFHKPDFLSHRIIKVFDKGGVDTLAEIEATRLELKKEIYHAVCRSTGLTHDQCKRNKMDSAHFWNQHYRPRNVQIARAGYLKEPYVLYDIEPAGSCSGCNGTGYRKIHIKDDPSQARLWKMSKIEKCPKCGGDGASSGGTWTLKETRKRKREVYKIVIE